MPVELTGDRAQERVDGSIFRMRLQRECARPGKSRIDDRQQRLRVDGLRNERRAEGGCQCLGFGRDMSGGPKHDPRLDRVRLRAQVEDELTTVHARREYVDDHEVRAFGANDPQRFLAVPGLQHTVPPVPEQRRNEPQIDGPVLDDKNRGHEPPDFSPNAQSDAQRAPSGPIPDKRSLIGRLCLRHASIQVTKMSQSVSRKEESEAVADPPSRGRETSPSPPPGHMSDSLTGSEKRFRLRRHHRLPLNHLSADASSRKL